MTVAEAIPRQSVKGKGLSHVGNENKKSTYGILSGYANAELRQYEDIAPEDAMIKKHERKRG